VIAQNAEKSVMSSLRRALALAVMVVCAAPAVASAAPRMYVSTARAADGTTSVSAYAFDGMTQITDTFQLDVVRGGGTVATDTQPGFVLLTTALQVGDELKLTNTTTPATRTVTYSGEPTLVAPTCGAATFSGTREDGSTVDVSSAGLSTVQFFGAGTTYAGAFSKPLTTGAEVKASQARAIDPAFTVFDAVTVAVGGTCPGAETPAPPVPVPVPAPAPAPVVPVTPPVPGPAPDAVAPAGRVAFPALKPVALYKALLAGTFKGKVSMGEPGTITQKLSAGKTVLGTGKVTAAKAGTYSLKVKLSKNGRRRLTKVKTTKLTLTTVLRDAAGNANTLPAKHLVARRGR
jgi:hypothetical protein